MEQLIRGAISGTLATLPMTVTMIRLRRRLPREWVKPLPPRQITLRMAHRVGLGRKLDRDGKRNLTWLSHYGYGALAGGLYAVPPAWLAGPLYGLAVWAVSYLGFMPALALYKPAVKDASSRNFLMILSHLVWGLFLGFAFKVLGRRDRSDPYWETPTDTPLFV